MIVSLFPVNAIWVNSYLEEYENGLPGTFRQLLERLGEHLKALDRQVQELEVQLQSWHRENVASKKLAQIPGIGPLTASALIASVGDAKSVSIHRNSIDTGKMRRSSLDPTFLLA